ncbi:hypothetical protein VP01_2052g5 [Puccinia sorghi]|uniref:Retrovirus-related Pol polyprotein from transposon TNT 1-94-like beta-barrel domain-containing protein n=1 Tax=Puccinia sorghi TaxID=27349 RepID=A0A0L6VCN3_9BASI|nr:hypothetical protein VP01_2052g5 [Puccinia sorghi]
MSKSTEDPMEKMNSVLYKTAIESIPIQHRITILCGNAVVNQKTTLSSSEELILPTRTELRYGILINGYFASTQSANRAHVWNNFSLLSYNDTNMHKVGIDIDIDVVGYDMIKKMEMTPDLDQVTPVKLIKSFCTPTTRILDTILELRIRLINAGCVSSFHTSLSYPSMHFMLNYGFSADMTSNVNLFFALKLKEKRIVWTSLGTESLKIKGTGSIKLTNEHSDFILHHVLSLPDLCVNLLSVKCPHKYLFSLGEMIHKALGHVSYQRLCQKLGIPLKDCNSCEACAVSKVTRHSFHTRNSRASKPFE